MRGRAVREVKRPFHSRRETQLKRVKSRTFLQLIQRNKHVFTVLALSFAKKKRQFFPLRESLFKSTGLKLGMVLKDPDVHRQTFEVNQERSNVI